jgi:hypothetical protein
MNLRCSSLPLAFRCPASVRTDTGVLIDQYHDAATDGTDVHRLLASHPDGDAPQALVEELSPDARILYYAGAKMWREHISAWMPNSEAETECECEPSTGVLVPGHIDRHSLNSDETEIVILDWKSGRKDNDHKEQGFGYAAGAFEKHPRLRRATVHFGWIRTQEIESYTIDRSRIVEWSQRLRNEVIEWNGVFHPGEHCEGCRRFASCEAHAAMNRQSLAVVTGKPLDLATMPGPEMATLYRRLSPLLSQIEGLQKAMRAEVKTRGEVLDGAGGVLHYVEQNAPREVDALKAWPILTEKLNDEELAACVKVSIGDVEETIAEKAAKANPKRGAKKEAKEALQAALAKAGAITQGKVLCFRDERKE